MAVKTSGSSSVPTLPPPCPKSPPEYPDLYGKRRALARVQMLEREISFLEDELKSMEGLQPASRSCKEVADYVVANADPLVPTHRKIRKSFRLWKWLCCWCGWCCGSSCFSFSWKCCRPECSDCCRPECSDCCRLPECCKCGPCNCCPVPCDCCSCFSCEWPMWRCCSWPNNICCCFKKISCRCRSNCCRRRSCICSRNCCILPSILCPDCSCCKWTCSCTCPKCSCSFPTCPAVRPCSNCSRTCCNCSCNPCCLFY